MAKKNNRSGFLFMFIIFLLLGVIIYTYRDKFFVLFNTGVTSGKNIINKKFEKKDSDDIATEKIDLMNKKNNKEQDKKNVQKNLFKNIDGIKKNINDIKEKVSNKVKTDKTENTEKNEEKVEEKNTEYSKKEKKEIVQNKEKNTNKIENNDSTNIKNTNEIKKENKIDKTKKNNLHSKNSRVYFSKLSNDEKLILVGVNRNIIYDNTPLTETIKILLNGPSNNEKSSDLITNIPNNTKLISIWIKNNTAYINFSNEFQYNSYGKDSTITQIKQVVYTATEFSNVKYVQILINGKIKKYLGGEGILIEKPFSRSDFS
jgi:spore germination protein GerM